MIGLILLALSWILLRFEKKGLGELGFSRPAARIFEFTIGFFLAGSFAALQQLLFAFFAHFAWAVNPDFTSAALLSSIGWNVNSVLYEELIFRGYLLYRFALWLGAFRAALISAIAFGIYHWFSMEVLGNPRGMIFIFILTGVFGWAMAVSFVERKSIFLPIGLHMGWNMISYIIFSNGPIGNQLLVAVSSDETIQLTGFPSLLISILLPLGPAFVILTYFWVIKRPKARNTDND